MWKMIRSYVRAIAEQRCAHCGTTQSVQHGYCSDECYLARGVDVF